MKGKAHIDPGLLAGMDEHLLAGFFEQPDGSALTRMARAVRRHLEHTSVAPWDGHRLYPAGEYSIWATGRAAQFSYSMSLQYRPGALSSSGGHPPDPSSQQSLQAVDEHMTRYYHVGNSVPEAFRLGGSGYTHSIPNFGRVAREGLSSYAQRVREGLAEARRGNDAGRADFYEAMQDVLAGIAAFHRRCRQALEDGGCADGRKEAARRSLLEALGRVPFQPVRSFYEALVATNFIYYLDGCDNLGRFDQDLGPYYDRDLAAGRTSPQEAVGLVRCLWENVDANRGWNVALGGTRHDGSPAYNALTLVCLEATKSIRRPNLALRVRRDAPGEVLDAAVDVIGTGCGLPALYNEEAYLQALRDAQLNIHEGDLADFAFGGCTETMVHGKSNVGSLDAGINLVHTLTSTLKRHLATGTSFRGLLDAYKADLREDIRQLVAGVNRDQQLKAQHQPQPIRSLLVDDCISTGREFNAGGARYNWSVINVGGLGNVADSLAAVRELVYEQKAIGGAELLTALQSDFQGSPSLLARIKACPRFGNDDPRVDGLAYEVSAFVYKELARHKPWRGSRFLPATLMFTTYGSAGEHLMATPDGRRAGAPIADSAGPVQGRDRSGPTAMIKSVAGLPHQLAPGTLVVNARFSKQLFESPESRAKLKDLIRTYFELGGTQIQINVVDQAVLRDALTHPEQHEDLIVRIGGYSEYFNRLSPALKESVLERVEH